MQPPQNTCINIFALLDQGKKINNSKTKSYLVPVKMMYSCKFGKNLLSGSENIMQTGWVRVNLTY